ncbi:MAG: spermidine synthase, partial [Actinomycetia bacterium]|nr:spermidine synthase [Actinomycetes bacterium]
VPGRLVALTILTVMALLLPAAVLSAVSPALVKLQLRSLDHTGQTVGRLSALGTIGALFGTFVTGFVLVAEAPSTAIVLGLGGFLVVAGLALWAYLSQLELPAAASVVVVALGGGWLNAVVDSPCELESAYFCASVVADVERESGRFLILDTLRHSYVDLDDPTYIEFEYAKSLIDAIDSRFPAGQPLDALHVGGGGFTLPRYLEATRPGSASLVLELDPGLVDLVRDELGLVTSETLRVRTGDARVGILDQADNEYDVVIGDAFGGLAVPWHLTTAEFIEEIERVLRPEGLYVINLIDYPPDQGFARAEAATLADVFEHVAIVVPPATIEGARGGNFVLVGSNTPIDTATIDASARSRDDIDTAVADDDLRGWIDGARVLTDEFAPVDQLLGKP